ncbi:MAG: histidine kinase [Lachnospiraceae bacterium]|nr:histidine kinase [Lachnospiraceae bacterium]
MKHKHKNMYYIFSLLFTVAGIIAINIIFHMDTLNNLKQRDEMLFSDACSLDSLLALQNRNLNSELKYILNLKQFHEIERQFGETGDREEMDAFLQDSLLFEKDIVEGVLIFDGEEQIYCLNVADKPGTYTYTFLEDLEEDDMYVVEDQNGRYAIAAKLKYHVSPYTYYLLINLDHFYDTIIPEHLRRSHWVVLYDPDSGLLVQNHDNQPPSMVLSRQEILDRQDGYSIMLENEMKGEATSGSYLYNNYYGVRVHVRIVTIPRELTKNRFFSIGVAMDSEELYTRMMGRLIIIIAIIILILLNSIAITRYVLIVRRDTKEADRLMQLKLRENELREALKEAQLQNSISQLQPHFLYNSLSSIREIVLESPEYAAELLLDFTNYLRACLRAMNSKELVPFEQELKNIQAYVGIEKMRLGDRLTVVYDIQDTDFMIIPLGIQPLVENAIRHGISKKRNKTGTVWVHTSRNDDYVEILVEDDGVGFDSEKKKQEIDAGICDSTGVKNLILRYKNSMNAELNGISKPGEGTRVWVHIPLKDTKHRLQNEEMEEYE